MCQANLVCERAAAEQAACCWHIHAEGFRTWGVWAHRALRAVQTMWVVLTTTEASECCFLMESEAGMSPWVRCLRG